MAKRSSTHICLICWQPEAATAHSARLKADGFRVTVVGKGMSGWITYFRDLAVDAVVIDLDRLPSHGHEVGTALRGSKSTRHLPLVFLGGIAEKVDRIRAELPDATYAAWADAATAARAAIASPPLKSPARPLQRMERNLTQTSGDRDLSRRLGVKPGHPVALLGDADFLLPAIGDAATISKRIQSRGPHLCLCVTHSATDVETAFETIDAAYPPGSTVWIIHPKQTGRLRADYNQNDVRTIGLARGWVDFKVCAVDADWSGLQFARRKAGQGLHRRPGRASAAH